MLNGVKSGSIVKVEVMYPNTALLNPSDKFHAYSYSDVKITLKGIIFCSPSLAFNVLFIDKPMFTKEYSHSDMLNRVDIFDRAILSIKPARIADKEVSDILHKQYLAYVEQHKLSLQFKKLQTESTKNLNELKDLSKLIIAKAEKTDSYNKSV